MNEENPTETTHAPSALTPVEFAGALPEGDVPLPPRPLVPGAFLSGAYEIKELLTRGLVNFYWASGGDYLQPAPFLIAERSLPVLLEQEGAESDPAALRATLNAPLIAVGHSFVQEGREYLVCAWQESSPLSDWREPTNDARYLHVMSTLLEAACELDAQHLTAEFSHDTLRFDELGDLKYFGFFELQPPNQPPISNLARLQEIHAFLLKHVFAESTTMRLDDEWSGLALSEEVKSFAARLKEGDFTTADEALSALPLVPHTGVLHAEARLLSDVGQEREINEDSGMIVRLARAGHLQNCEVALYAVADGMGGHEGGEVASDLTLNALQNAFFARSGLDWHDNVAVRATLWEILEEVNVAVVELTEGAQYRALRNKPGATLVCALRVGQTLFVGNVGDSRAYLWDTALGLSPITKDHSYVQTLIDSGQLDPSQAWGHPEGSVITAHIGMPKLKQCDVFLRLAQPGAKLLLFSDGVMDMLRDEEIAPLAESQTPTQICRDIVEAANAAGGHDNITAICVNFE
jgi:serine/threonine protein phosphatase PrpC